MNSGVVLSTDREKKADLNTSQSLGRALTSELCGRSAVGRGLPAVLVFFKLLHPADVQPPVVHRHVQDEHLEYLSVLHHCQLHLGPRETLGVVAVETGLPHVDPGDEEFVLRPVCPHGQKGPLDHRQSRVAPPLGDDASESDVLTLLGHRERRGTDGSVDGQTQIWRLTTQQVV